METWEWVGEDHGPIRADGKAVRFETVKREVAEGKIANKEMQIGNLLRAVKKAEVEAIRAEARMMELKEKIRKLVTD